MEKWTRAVFVLALASVFVLTGCQKKEEAAAPAPAAEAAMTPAATEQAAETTGVAECDSYLAALEKYMNCQNVPQAARDAQQTAAQQMRNSWASWAGLPEEARKTAQAAAKTSCTTALTTLKQAATASGCPIE